jgi:hypothetical protein
MVENGTGISLTGYASEDPQAANYILERRPSQPDFLIDPTKVNEVFLKSRYRLNSLADYDGKMEWSSLYMLRRALARADFDVMAMGEFEQPLRLSGGVFMSPPWQRNVIEQNPFMLTLHDFTQYMKQMRINEALAHNAFRYIGRELLDGGRAESTDTHRYALDRFSGGWYMDIAVGLFTIDSVAAYRVVFEKWQALLQSGQALPFEAGMQSWDGERDKILKLSHEAISGKIPHSWFNRAAEFAPPQREEDFDF